MLASTRIRRPFKHELFMKTKKSMELAGFSSIRFGDFISICPDYDSSLPIPGTAPSPWVLEAVIKVVKEWNPDAKVNIYVPEKNIKHMRFWNTGLRSSSKLHDDKIIVTGASFGRTMKGAYAFAKTSGISDPKFCVADATLCYFKRRLYIKDAIISSDSPVMIDSALRFMFGFNNNPPEFKGDLPMIRNIDHRKQFFMPENIWYLIAGKHKIRDFIRKQQLYSQEFMQALS